MQGTGHSIGNTEGEYREFSGNTLLVFPIYAVLFPKGAII